MYEVTDDDKQSVRCQQWREIFHTLRWECAEITENICCSCIKHVDTIYIYMQYLKTCVELHIPNKHNIYTGTYTTCLRGCKPNTYCDVSWILYLLWNPETFTVPRQASLYLSLSVAAAKHWQYIGHCFLGGLSVFTS